MYCFKGRYIEHALNSFFILIVNVYLLELTLMLYLSRQKPPITKND